MKCILLIGLLAVILAIGSQRVCLEDIATGEVICAPFESPLAGQRVINLYYLPLVVK